MREADFLILKISNGIVVPKEQCIAWVQRYIEGGDQWKHQK